MTEEDEEFERIAAKCKETQRVNESKWNSEMCSNYGGFCKKEWVGLTDEELREFDVDPIEAKLMIAKLKEKNDD